MTKYILLYGRFPAGCEGKLYGVSIKNPNGTYAVWINTEMDEAIQAHALRHELAHLVLEHLEQEDPETEEAYQERERITNEYADNMTTGELEYLLSFCTQKKEVPESFIANFDERYTRGEIASM